MKTLASELEKLNIPLPPKKKISKETITNILGRPKKFPDYTFQFGRHKGSTLEEVALTDRNYLIWLLDQEWFVKTRPLIVEALEVASE